MSWSVTATSDTTETALEQLSYAMDNWYEAHGGSGYTDLTQNQMEFAFVAAAAALDGVRGVQEGDMVVVHLSGHAAEEGTDRFESLSLHITHQLKDSVEVEAATGAEAA